MLYHTKFSCVFVCTMYIDEVIIISIISKAISVEDKLTEVPSLQRGVEVG